MTFDEVKKTEAIAAEVVEKNLQVYAMEASLAQAKAVQGLRAVFEEVKLVIFFFHISQSKH